MSETAVPESVSVVVAPVALVAPELPTVVPVAPELPTVVPVALVAPELPTDANNGTNSEISELIDQVKSLITETTELSSPADILSFIPQIASFVNVHAFPGNIKKTKVLAALHFLIQELLANKKINEEIALVANTLIDTVAPTAIDAIVSVAKGKVQFNKETAVTVAKTTCTLCVGFWAAFGSKKAATKSKN